MEPIVASDIENRHVQLRDVIKRASEVIAQYWPMRTFVHHNPLHSLEYLSFEDAVRRAKQFTGGDGYLPGDIYRTYVKSGRITIAQIETALEPLAKLEEISFGTRALTHRDVMRACLVDGLCAPIMEPLEEDRTGLTDDVVERLAARLDTVRFLSEPETNINTLIEDDQAALGCVLTLSGWCDDTLGTQIVSQTNEQLIKWCEAFLDEGHAVVSMPKREKGLYQAWKAIASYEWSPCGITDSKKKIAQLPDCAEDAIDACLDALAIPAHLQQDYLSLQLGALPGWASFIKWRVGEQEYPWQLAYPASLVDFLAIRLWYECELIKQVCHEKLNINGGYSAISTYIQTQSIEYFFRRRRVAGKLPARYAQEVDRFHSRKKEDWEKLFERYEAEIAPQQVAAVRHGAAHKLLALAKSLDLAPDTLVSAASEQLEQLLEWMASFPESKHGPVWLKAFETGYHEQLVNFLRTGLLPKPIPKTVDDLTPTRPYSQSVYCIDVRSEPFRRQLESVGSHETFGFAGFFAASIRYRAWGKEHDTDQCPVILRPKNEVWELPRSYLDDYKISTHLSRTHWLHTSHTLLHDLKENVATPYVMVESLGWFYGFPIFGKTLIPSLYQRWTAWMRRLFVPTLATTLTVDKLASPEAEGMLQAEQQILIRKALQERLGLARSNVTPIFVEKLRRHALDEEQNDPSPMLLEAAIQAGLTPDMLKAFVITLRLEYGLNPQSASQHKEQLTRTGFSIEEQATTVDTALRMMGLTKNFARLVLFCAHGSESENNPYEAALDCGACGGNEGKPNARVLAMMANNLTVRAQVAKQGIDIPSDTHFLAGQISTTTDVVELFDLEDVPMNHRADLVRLKEDLNKASKLANRERSARFPDVAKPLEDKEAESHVLRRSLDWSQVRPEWGLSGNTAFLIARRELSKGLDLGGRVFLHSYDYREDPDNRLLEILLTAPQVVAQWINMEHYFSTVDNEVYGSSSKIYHNVVGRFGVMSGPWSDLRLGLAKQTVMNGDMPYHEPMRMLTIIEAPRARIEALIGRHELLQHYYHNEWVHLAAFDPEDQNWYRYSPRGEWHPVP